MGRFKGKKKKSNLIIYIGLFLISMAFSIKYLYDENLIKNDTLVDILINDNLGSFKNNINDVDFLLKYALNIDLEKEAKVEVPIENREEESVTEQLGINEPIVYIYNTHQDEKYQSAYLEPYNINTTVFMASKMLKEYLENLGVGVIVEENSVSEKLNSLNLKYGSSYKVTRMFLESAKENNPSLKFFIDLHRDSSKYENTTTEIDGESYAKVLFVIGLDNASYANNLALAEKLKSKVEEFNESLSRGILQKSGKGVNGVYNQDFDSNTILIEVGGQYNNIGEVNNTLKILADILASYIKENLNG